MYSWTNVAARTERVYNGISGTLSEEDFYGVASQTPLQSHHTNHDQQEEEGAEEEAAVGIISSGTGGNGLWTSNRHRAGVGNFALIDRLKRYYGCGIWAGKLFCVCVVVDYLIYVLLEVLAPREGIDVAVNWPRKEVGVIVGGDGEQSGEVRKGRRRERRRV